MLKTAKSLTIITKQPLHIVFRLTRKFCSGIELSEASYDVPRYTKINAWDRRNSNIKTLGKILSTKRDRQKSDSIVLEGTRIIKDAIDHGFSPSVVVFSRLQLLHQLSLPKNTSSRLYHIPYNNLKLWTDLTTSPGIMAAISKNDVTTKVIAHSPLPLTLICDNIRQPDNLGAVLRVAAAAGAQRVLLTTGCVNAWSPKVVRAAAGAHFLLPIVEEVKWSAVDEKWPMVVLADLLHDKEYTGEPDSDVLEKLEEDVTEQGIEEAFNDENLCNQFHNLPLRTKSLFDFELDPGYKEIVVVVGGETEVR